MSIHVDSCRFIEPLCLRKPRNGPFMIMFWVDPKNDHFLLKLKVLSLVLQLAPEKVVGVGFGGLATF